MDLVLVYTNKELRKQIQNHFGEKDLYPTSESAFVTCLLVVMKMKYETTIIRVTALV